MIKITDSEYRKGTGYYKVRLSNEENMLLSVKEYNQVNQNNQSNIMFESTSGNFYLHYGSMCFKKA
ncbi:hypothetical protein FZC83_02215 [Rossellomorea marisflavi]|uniref:Uncharacterized protein n=1 Tax=Rossellomorea marisflavi TaxID=189381 RepID=A0A5D4S1I5_9BACI|nr:hypothetical protein [Rossellomorea marisflavi]TYS56411.1 hypothetical protein FZC83_02215 [Rossellomorea marisflavi]